MKIKLDDIENKNPYQVPEGYFESLTADIQGKIAVEKRPAFFKTFKLALIPSFAAILAIAFWFIQLDKTDTMSAETLLAQVSQDEILNYLDESELSITELVSLTSDPDQLLEEDPNYLNGLDLDEENIDDLINTFDLNEIYL
ncbi:MAG: hypothetical protein JXR03_05055 [Cyclobacteriaceae bacterium]